MKHRHDAGFSLAALIFFLTAASILMAAAVPAYKMQSQREREKELIFRGEEYMRAILKYQRKFGVYPQSLDALVETNGLKFIRRAYKDPLTDKEFRLIYINPDGSITGSTLFQQRIGNAPLFQGSNPQPIGTQPVQSQPVRVGGGVTPNPQANPQANPQLNPQPNSQTNRQPNQTPRTGQFTPAGSTPGNQNQTFGTAGIVGVASDSQETSVMIYNNRQKYNEWEFIALMMPGQPGQPGQPGVLPGAMPGAMPGMPGAMPGMPGTMPGMSPGGTPGGTPGGMPGMPGQRPDQQIQQPFGFGVPPQPQQPVKRP